MGDYERHALKLTALMLAEAPDGHLSRAELLAHLIRVGNEHARKRVFANALRILEKRGLIVRGYPDIYVLNAYQLRRIADA